MSASEYAERINHTGKPVDVEIIVVDGRFQAVVPVLGLLPAEGDPQRVYNTAIIEEDGQSKVLFRFESAD